MTPSESGEKVSESKVPLVLLPQKACFHAFEGPKNLLGPYMLSLISLTIKGCVRVSVCVCVSHTYFHHHPPLSLLVRIKHLDTPSQCSDSELNI